MIGLLTTILTSLFAVGLLVIVLKILGVAIAGIFTGILWILSQGFWLWVVLAGIFIWKKVVKR